MGQRNRCTLRGHLLLLSVAALLTPIFSRAAELADLNALLSSGKYEKCAEQAATALISDPTNENLAILKIQAELTLGHYADAAKSLANALKTMPKSLRLRWLGHDVLRYSGQAGKVADIEAEMTLLLQQTPWRYSDALNQVTLGRFMLSKNIDPKKVLNSIYSELKKQQPNNIDVWIAIGDLALSKHDYKLAGDSFQQAVKLDAKNPDAQLGVAKSFASSDSEKEKVALHAALESNPRHLPSLQMLADEQIDSEEYDEADKTLKRIFAVNPKEPLGLAYQALLHHLRNEPEKEKQQRAAALQTWAANPAVDHLIGQKLSQKYRFAEGAEYQREALKLDPNYLPAKIDLAQDLMRLGKEEEGLKLADAVYDEDAYNVLAHNLVTLQENLGKFRTLESDGLMVRMDAREADIYGNRVLGLLKRAKKMLCEKYDVRLEKPVIVELFPKQQDFAIRTFGMPGGAGFLGVCFGSVITANSAGSPGANSTCWEATLWHEFCHVVTLNKTNNKMPRWLSEGISVYEERQADPTWGQSFNPKYREMILGDSLTPVSGLSGAFLHAKTPLDLQFAYFESSLVVEYLVKAHGLKTLQRVLHDLGAGMPINESLGRYTGSLESLDAEFAKWARQRAESMAPEADWTTAELSRRAKLQEISEWLKEHPKNLDALRRLATQQIGEKKTDDAKATLQELIQLYPGDSASAGAYWTLGKLYRDAGDAASEYQTLEKLAAMTSDNVEVFGRLCDLAERAEDWGTAKKYALRWLAVNPLSPSAQRRAASAAEKAGDYALAIESYRALLLLDPYDMADLHFKLGSALRQRGDLIEAKKHALLALEETPRFRAAQKLLLEIVEALPKSDGDSPPVATPSRPVGAGQPSERSPNENE
jgi:tetratricopeptide (TPR) repeat protein